MAATTNSLRRLGAMRLPWWEEVAYKVGLMGSACSRGLQTQGLRVGTDIEEHDVHLGAQQHEGAAAGGGGGSVQGQVSGARTASAHTM